MGKNLFITALAFKFKVIELTTIKIQFFSRTGHRQVLCGHVCASGGHRFGHLDRDENLPSSEPLPASGSCLRGGGRVAQDTGRLRLSCSWKPAGLGFSEAGLTLRCPPLLWWQESLGRFPPPSLELDNPVTAALLRTFHVLGAVLQAVHVLNLFNAHKTRHR